MTPEERAQFVADIAEAIRDTVPSPLTADESQWVRMAIKREAQSIAFREAVIRHTTSGLMLLGVVGVLAFFGGLLADFAAAHGWKR